MSEQVICAPTRFHGSYYPIGIASSDDGVVWARTASQEDARLIVSALEMQEAVMKAIEMMKVTS